jgi:hypothetical protein
VTNNIVRSAYCNNPPGGHNLCAKKNTDVVTMVDHAADLVVLQEGLLVFAVKAVARAGPKEEGEFLEVEVKAEEAHKKLK